MILFESDWEKHQEAIPDFNTRNASFLRMSALYKKMGINNHLFMLALHNRRLIGVDPYDPNLDRSTILEIAHECRINPWYFFRECVRVPGSTDEFFIPFRANRGSMAFFWMFFNHITQIRVQPRQTGKSFDSDVLNGYLLSVGTTNTKITLLTKDDVLRSSNLERLKNIISEFPYYLNTRNKNDIGNTEELTVKELKNKYTALLPRAAPKDALKVGRGLTTAIFQCDEFAFINNCEITIPAAIAATSAAIELAKQKNEPWGIFFTTTAGKKDDRDGRYAYNFYVKSAIMTEKFYDTKNIEDLEMVIRKNSPSGELKVNITFNHRQLGFTDEWMREVLERTNSTGQDADRDYFNVWSSGSQSHPLSQELLDKIKNSIIPDPVVDITRPYGYILNWYIEESTINVRMNTGMYVIGIDSSDAVGGDDISLHIREVTTGDTIATGKFNETNLITFSTWLTEFLIKYSNTVLIIERRSTGAMILDYIWLMLISKNINPFKRIYNTITQKADENRDLFNLISKPTYHLDNDFIAKNKKAFGFATSSGGLTSRTDLYSTTFTNAAKNTGFLVKDKTIIHQISSLVTRNGRVDHEVGEHDDCVISWLLTYWLITQGKNLSFYGIESRTVLSENKFLNSSSTIKEQLDDYEQYNLRTEIEELVEEIKKEKDRYIVDLLENKLRFLSTKLNEDDRIMLSVDSLIEKLRESKRSSYNRSNYYNRY